MAKPGDTVRYLNAVGGGIITRIDGKIAYVEDGGFETPVLLKELVVVLPVGHEPKVKGANLMFDQAAFDEGKNIHNQDKKTSDLKKEVSAQSSSLIETAYGDNINLSLAFESTNIKNLTNSQFSAVLVNDSNYFASVVFLGKKTDKSHWALIFQGIIEPNELTDLAIYSHDTLGEIENIAFQAIFFKRDKDFLLKAPVSSIRKLDLTKFYKLHSFKKSNYFDDPVIEIPIITDDIIQQPLSLKTDTIEKALKEKIKVDNPQVKKEKRPENNPYKLLPLIEVDLHMSELTDTTLGLRPSDMLQMQLNTVRDVMKQHERRKGQKIVFIHGKGEGVLRNAVLGLLRKEYPKSTTQDASFREYGFGATLVTIH